MAGKENNVNGYLKEDMYITINKNELKNLKVALKYDGPLKAPVLKDEKIGDLIIETKSDRKLIPVYSSEKIKKVNFLKVYSCLLII